MMEEDSEIVNIALLRTKTELERIGELFGKEVRDQIADDLMRLNSEIARRARIIEGAQ